MDGEKQLITGYQNYIELSSQIELYRIIIHVHCILESRNSDKLPSSTEQLVLAYYCAFGVTKDTDRFVLENRVVSNHQILSNVKTKLTKKELLVKYKRGLKVCKALDFKISDNATSFVICKIKAKSLITLEEHV